MENSNVELDSEIDPNVSYEASLLSLQTGSMLNFQTGYASTADSSLTGSSTTPDLQAPPKGFNKMTKDWRSELGIIFTKLLNLYEHNLR